MKSEDGTCSAISCGKPATMTINLRVSYSGSESYEDSVPYCDEDFGWFYRSFSRKSYHTEILGVTILKDLDVEFELLYPRDND